MEGGAVFSVVRGAVVAVVAAVALVLFPAGGVFADDYDDAIVPRWAGPTVNLAWDGSEYMTVQESFIGSPVVVPGDSAVRELTVVNDGPSAGLLSVSIVDVEVANPGAADVHHATGEELGDFYEDLRLAWVTEAGAGSASFRELSLGGDFLIGEVPLGRGEDTFVKVGYVFPFEATSGNQANVPFREARFDVELTIGGDLPGDGVVPSPSPSPGGSPVDWMVDTGVSGFGWLLAAGGLAAGVGVVFGVVGRRRRTGDM